MSDALAAALLATQKRQADPNERYRKYGEMLMQQGASTAPVRSPLEGLARALTGAAGGFFAGQADRTQEEKQRRTLEGLSSALAAPDEASRNQILQGLKGDPDILAPFLATTLSQKIADERKNGILDRRLDASGVPGLGGGTGLGGGQPGPLTINMTPLPNQSVAPGAFANNTGNIRATPGVSFPGQGAPQNGFMTFETPQAGVNAHLANLQAYGKANPNITVAQAIAKWAPPTENNTQQYISQVAEGTGINPGMPLAEVLRDPAMAAQLLDAMTRKEKGGLPTGVTADTFMAATGGGQPPVQVAQGGGDPSGTPIQPRPQTAPAIVTPDLPEISPAAATLFQQAQQLRAGGDREGALALMQQAQKVQATYAQERALKMDERGYGQAKTADERTYGQEKTADQRAYEAAEHDRREANKPLTKDQSDAATFADRMARSHSILTDPRKDAPPLDVMGTNGSGRLLESKVFGVGIPGANRALSSDYQKFMQARSNFINAQLRRESGAVISDSEYEAADKQYFPQPGDKPEVIEQKRQNRIDALEGMKRAAGRGGPTAAPTGGAQSIPNAPAPVDYKSKYGLD